MPTVSYPGKNPVSRDFHRWVRKKAVFHTFGSETLPEMIYPSQYFRQLRWSCLKSGHWGFQGSYEVLNRLNTEIP